ncbi:efflux transporter outer membrane subunit, partial [Massilia cavernae]
AFGDASMNELVDKALARNTDVLLSIARVDEARALAQAADSARLPTLNAGAGIGASHSLGPTGISTHRSIQPELQASWELDLWDRVRAQSRASSLQYLASQAERDGVALAVAASTARAWVTLLALDEQLRITRGTADARAEALRLASDQARVGYISQLQLTQAQSEHEAVLQAIPQLELAVRRQENALRVLTGEAPGAIARTASLPALRLPALPSALPSELLVRRPDVVQRELLLAATDAALDARRAAFMPQVNLSASIGALLTNGLDYNPETIWSLGGSILAPVFNAGRLAAQVDAATAQRDQAAYAYRGTVLAAFGEVENTLGGVGRLEEQMEHSQKRRAVLARTLDFARDRYQAGYAPYLEVLDAQRALYQVQLDAVTLRQNQLNNVIDLYRALGGGWQRD